MKLLLQRLGLKLELLMHVLLELGRQTLLLDLGRGASTLLAQRKEVGGDSFLSYSTIRVSWSSWAPLVTGWWVDRIVTYLRQRWRLRRLWLSQGPYESCSLTWRPPPGCGRCQPP